MLSIYPGKNKSSNFIFLVEENKDIQSRVYRTLMDHFNKIPLFMLLPRYPGIPQPVQFCRLMETPERGRFLYLSSGLWREVLECCKHEGISYNKDYIDIPEWKYTGYNESEEELTTRISSWGLNIAPRSYQIHAAWLILKYKLSLSELATRAGKTLIFYIVSRAAMEYLGAQRILMVVPSIHLVRQGQKDLTDYGSFFNIGCISGENKEDISSCNIVVGTFQSLTKRTKEFFETFDVVCIDEAHRAPAKSIANIIDRLGSYKLKFGFTGSLPQANTIESLACQALLGPCIQKISASELIEQGYLATPIIHQILINHQKSTELDAQIRKCGLYLCSNQVYKRDSSGKKVPVLLPPDQHEFTMDKLRTPPLALSENSSIQEIIELCRFNMQTLNLEVMLSERSEKHTQAIIDIINKTNGNIIVFSHHTTYASFLQQQIEQYCPDKIVHTIVGSTSLKKRQQILDLCKTNDNMIAKRDIVIIGSYGCISTGLTFHNIQAGILAQSFKSEIINKQSLGRLMLRDKDKCTFDLYDIIDSFPYGLNKLKSQGKEKMKLYEREGYQTASIFSVLPDG